ncbi:hypothetical protein IM538_06480 [Cytobacillus suaedae]|nr:hypothetical protein IM538_06480 [Cytobacillus suaedae]
MINHLRNNKKLYDKIVLAIIVAASLFLFLKWENTKEQNELNNERHSQILLYHFRGIVSIISDVEETIQKYSFPLSNEDRSQFQNAVRKDTLHLNHLSHSITLSRPFNNPETLFFLEETLWKLEKSIQGIAGFDYTAEDMLEIQQILRDGTTSLGALVYEEFEVEEEEQLKEYIAIFRKLTKELEPYNKY